MKILKIISILLIISLPTLASAADDLKLITRDGIIENGVFKKYIDQDENIQPFVLTRGITCEGSLAKEVNLQHSDYKLAQAVTSYDFDSVKLLMGNKEISSKEINSALRYSLIENCFEIFKYIIENTENVNQTGGAITSLAIYLHHKYGNRKRFFRYLFTKGIGLNYQERIEGKIYVQAIPLCQMIYYGWLDEIKRYDKAVNPDYDSDTYTKYCSDISYNTVSFAIFFDKLDIIKFLVEEKNAPVITYNKRSRSIIIKHTKISKEYVTKLFNKCGENYYICHFNNNLNEDISREKTPITGTHCKGNISKNEKPYILEHLSVIEQYIINNDIYSVKLLMKNKDVSAKQITGALQRSLDENCFEIFKYIIENIDDKKKISGQITNFAINTHNKYGNRKRFYRYLFKKRIGLYYQGPYRNHSSVHVIPFCQMVSYGWLDEIKYYDKVVNPNYNSYAYTKHCSSEYEYDPVSFAIYFDELDIIRFLVEEKDAPIPTYSEAEQINILKKVKRSKLYVKKLFKHSNNQEQHTACKGKIIGGYKVPLSIMGYDLPSSNYKLVQAVVDNDFNSVNELMKNKNISTNEIYEAIRYSMNGNCFDIFKNIVDNIKDNKLTGSNITNLTIYLHHKYGGMQKFYRYLFENEIDLGSKGTFLKEMNNYASVTPFCHMIYYGWLDEIKYYDAILKPDYSSGLYTKHCSSIYTNDAISYAISRGKTDIIKFLVEERNAPTPFDPEYFSSYSLKKFLKLFEQFKNPEDKEYMKGLVIKGEKKLRLMIKKRKKI